MISRARLHRALDAVMDGINYGPNNPTGKCRECGGRNYGKYDVCQVYMRKPVKVSDGVYSSYLNQASKLAFEGEINAALKLYRQVMNRSDENSDDYKRALREFARLQAEKKSKRANDAGRAPSHYMHEAVNLYHLARTALSGKDDGRWARLHWAANEMHKKYPDVSAIAFYMSLSDDWLR